MLKDYYNTFKFHLLTANCKQRKQKSNFYT